MNFDLGEEQLVVRDLATQVLTGSVTAERSKAAEAEGEIDRALWRTMADAGLLALALPGDLGGSDMGLVELCLVAEQVGRTTAPVPYVVGAVAAMTLADAGVAADLVQRFAVGDALLTVAVNEPGINDAMTPSATATAVDGGYRISGTRVAVPIGQHADAVIVPVRHEGGVALALVDRSGFTATAVQTTALDPHAHLALDAVVPSLFGDEVALAEMIARLHVGICAVALGVARGSLALTASHVSTRTQFGKPLAAQQAVGQRAADAYITAGAMEVTVLNAAWRLAAGLDARNDVAIAMYWATEGVSKVVLAGQHLHGGLGSDVDHPVSRYFLLGTQLATATGSPTSHLARLGRLIAAT